MEYGKISKEQALLAEEIQKECHKFIEDRRLLIEGLSYQDLANVYFFYKLAELQIEINNLKQTKI